MSGRVRRYGPTEQPLGRQVVRFAVRPATERPALTWNCRFCGERVPSGTVAAHHAACRKLVER